MRHAAGALLGVACAVLMAVCLAPVSRGGASPEQLRRQVVDAIAARGWERGDRGVGAGLPDWTRGAVDSAEPSAAVVDSGVELKLIRRFALITPG